MPQLNYTSQVDARTLRSNAPTLPANASADAFGGNVGAALSNVGQGLNDVANSTIRVEDKQRKEAVANGVASFDFTKDALDLRNQVDSNATDYAKLVSEKYREKVEDAANAYDDDNTRTEFRRQLLSQLPGVVSQAEQYEFGVRQDNSKREANSALSTLQNKVAQSPANYDEIVLQGNQVIDARPDLPASLKASMRDTWRYDASKRRFEGMLDAATTPEAIDGIARELVSGQRDWQKEMRPEDYSNLVDKLGTVRKQYQSQIKTTVSASVTALEDRSKKVSIIPLDELRTVQQQAMQSGDPSLASRLARLSRDQEINRTEMRSSPSELRGRINAVNGNPGAAYPDLPVEVSDSINRAGQAFGISPAYLGGMVTSEYGQYLKRQKPTTNPSFAPTIASKNFDTRNVRPDVMDAVTIAGQIAGGPLTVVDAAAMQGEAQGNYIGISTLGMSPAEKAKIAGALVDAGFTGFSEYDNYMRVSMSKAVPKNFGDVNGQTWGGWTMLSPDVANVLKARGFAAGADSSIIQRNLPPEQKAAQIDYGKGTSILGDNGQPTSSAVGIGQFTEGTFLDVMKQSGVAARLGIDVSSMTDAQILDLRKNPDVSIMASAALASRNKSTLEEALGRPVNDAEIYMAHFMGAQGALAFLSARDSSPDQAAAELLPKAAAANKPVFYRDGQALTVDQVYNNISRRFSLSPSRVAYEDNQQRQRILEDKERSLKDDMIAYTQRVGTHNVPALNEEGGFGARGKIAMAIADYNNIPYSDMRPFTNDEMNALKSQIDTGSSDRVIEVMGSIAEMDTIPAKQAMKQLGEKDPVFNYAGSLYLSGNRSVASDIIRGRKRLEENPALKTALGISDDSSTGVSSAFVAATGNALAALAPSDRQAVQDAALAYWVQQSGNSGEVKRFDNASYSKAVQSVLGGTEDKPAIDDVNGHLTLLPPGMSADQVERALSNMELIDWAQMSEKKTVPRLANGDVANPANIRGEVMLRPAGGGKYRVMLDDGSYLVTEDLDANGNFKPFYLIPDAKKMADIADRPRQYSNAWSLTDLVVPPNMQGSQW